MEDRINTKTLEQLYQDDQYILIDIRNAADYHNGHIPGARSLPFMLLPEYIHTLSPCEHYFIICYHGINSEQAAAYLRQQGFSAASVSGGMADWHGPLTN